ncbi:rni-like superfamily protein [Anaeramoeba ignava]|uniref:Rni-like superfamily protein n=1 Tax=Anaeramoeba ignava TaxID=1746090 RepID=A0A9Q0RDB8_ANAIG|nr:rni-like superfamily protein [Anaeramoeba ignava]
MDPIIQKLQSNDSNFIKSIFILSQVNQEKINLISLSLKNNQVLKDLTIQEISVKYFHFISKAVEKNKSIKKLNISHNNFGEKGANDIKKIIENNKEIIELNIGFNSFETKSIEIICEGLKQNSTLKKIDFSYNSIDDEGIKCISETLKINQNLTSINLKGNSMKEMGLKYLSECLCLNSTLTELDISYNKTEGNFLADFLDSLSQNSVLQRLNIGSNQIHPKEGKIIGEKLINIKSLTHLDISKNEIEDIAIVSISESLQKTRNITHLNIANTSYTQMGLDHLIQMLKKNLFIQNIQLTQSDPYVKYKLSINKQFNDPFIQDMARLFERRELCDIEITTKTGCISVHKSIMLSRIGEHCLKRLSLISYKYPKNEVYNLLFWIYTGFVPDESLVQSFSDILNEIEYQVSKFEKKSKKNGLKKDFKKLYKNFIPNDFSIVLETGKEIKCHKSILIARSDLFRGMLINVIDPSNKVHEYRNSSFSSIKSIIKYFYLDKLKHDISFQARKELDDAAEFYQMYSDLNFNKLLKKFDLKNLSKKKQNRKNLKRKKDLKLN